MRALEKAGRLDRAVEFLPDDEALADRSPDGRGLTRPELAVLLAYAKISLYDELLNSDLPDDPVLIADLKRYFPPPLQERFAGGAGRPPPAARDHRDLGHQLDGQPRRPRPSSTTSRSARA